jgi:hypothetical protein
MTEYDIAQICLNGHVTNDAIERKPENNEEYCERCGKPTITECPKCKTPIRGHPYFDNGVNLAMYIDAPRFCIACGCAFPWFETKLQAAKEIASMHEDLNDKDRELLKSSFDDLIQDDAKSEAAAFRIRPVLNKIKRGAKDPLYKLVVDIGSEAIKKILLGDTDS